MSDRLTLSNAFEDAGIERNKAERIASTIFNAIHDNVATKVDILMVRTDIEKLSDATKAESVAIRSDLGKLAMSLRGEIAAIRGEVALLEQRMLVRLGGMMVVAVGVILTAIRYLHP